MFTVHLAGYGGQSRGGGKSRFHHSSSQSQCTFWPTRYAAVYLTDLPDSRAFQIASPTEKGPAVKVAIYVKTTCGLKLKQNGKLKNP